MLQKEICFIVAGLMLIAIPVFAENQWLKKAGEFANSQINTAKNVSLSDTKIGQGLKEALKVGIDNAVKLTGKRTDILPMTLSGSPCHKNCR